MDKLDRIGRTNGELDNSDKLTEIEQMVRNLDKSVMVDNGTNYYYEFYKVIDQIRTNLDKKYNLHIVDKIDSKLQEIDSLLHELNNPDILDMFEIHCQLAGQFPHLEQ